MAVESAPGARARTSRGGPATVDLPLVGEVAAERAAFYAGLGVMVLLDLIDWPVALAVGAGHAVAVRAHSRALKEFAEGIEAGA
jgi:hypothetical protein